MNTDIFPAINPGNPGLDVHVPLGMNPRMPVSTTELSLTRVLIGVLSPRGWPFVKVESITAAKKGGREILHFVQDDDLLSGSKKFTNSQDDC
ncbi:MAG: hypothetical protein ACREQ4_10785 [Candidatus Binataceae bacterium]